MTSTAGDYFASIAAHFDRLASEQSGAIEATATIFADVIARRGTVHVHDTGHMIGHELVARTGGFLAFERLAWQSSLERGAVARPPEQGPDDPARSATALVDWVFAQGGIQPGDALVLSSVSGVSILVVELALQAQRRGLPVVALTSTEFSSRLEPRHPSGKRLDDAADVVLDNLAPYGDATFALPGMAQPLCPISGLAGTALLWAAVASAAQRLVTQGIEPSVYPSINLSDGPARVAAIEARYRDVRQ